MAVSEEGCEGMCSAQLLEPVANGPDSRSLFSNVFVHWVSVRVSQNSVSIRDTFDHVSWLDMVWQYDASELWHPGHRGTFRDKWQDNGGLTSMKRSPVTVMVSGPVISSNDEPWRNVGSEQDGKWNPRPISSVCAVPLVVIGPYLLPLPDEIYLWIWRINSPNSPVLRSSGGRTSRGTTLPPTFQTNFTMSVSIRILCSSPKSMDSSPVLKTFPQNCTRNTKMTVSMLRTRNLLQGKRKQITSLINKTMNHHLTEFSNPMTRHLLKKPRREN